MGNLVSVIIPYTESDVNLLKKTVQSVRSQEGIQTEIIVVNTTQKSVKKHFEKIHEVMLSVSDFAEIYASGLQKAAGAYTSFFNCGDTASSSFFKDAVKVFEKNPEARFVAVNSLCVNPSLKEPYKNKTNLIFEQNDRISCAYTNVTHTADHVHFSLNAALFKTNVFQVIPFTKGLLYETGSDFMIRLMLKYPNFAFCLTAEYQYFMPQEDDFQYFIPANDKEWYTRSMNEAVMPLLLYCEKTLGSVPDFVQAFAMYMLQARFLSNMNNRVKRNMSETELYEFFASVSNILNLLEDALILNKNRYSYLRYSLELGEVFLYFKYHYENGKLPLTYTEGYKEIYLSYNNVHITTLSSKFANIHVMDYRGGKIFIDGSFREIFNTENLNLYAVFEGKKYKLENNDRYSLTKYFDISFYKKFTFHLELPLCDEDKVQKLSFFARIKDTIVPLNIGFIHHWAKLAANPSNSYWRFRNKTAFYDWQEKCIVFKNASAFDTLKREMKLLAETLPQSKKSFIYRLSYWLTRPYFKHKKIWYMYDKMYKGGDSSEYLYRYCRDKNDGVTRYYVIDNNTPDMKKLKADGFKPIKNRSLFAKLAFFNADIVLITNANTFPFNGFSMEYSRFIRGFCNFQTMCLQHGLTVQKCAMAQQRVVDNTVRYFVASKYEVGNLEHHAYNYKGFDIVKLTGIARYDGLISNDKKQILLSPTWRMYNAMPVKTSEGEQRAYNPEFKHTTYFKIYNDLINNEKLISCAKRCGYKIKYLLHPILSAQAGDFTPNSEVEVIPSVGDLSYEKILTESSLMVTDYSGVQFDFAYMKKPLVYFHPSQLPAHYENGCFFYDTMGFGPICTESEELVNTLCEYMENGCKMQPMYVERVNDFYAYDDHENCRRIYDQVLEYQQVIDRDKMRKK